MRKIRRAGNESLVQRTEFEDQGAVLVSPFVYLVGAAAILIIAISWIGENNKLKK